MSCSVLNESDTIRIRTEIECWRKRRRLSIAQRRRCCLTTVCQLACLALLLLLQHCWNRIACNVIRQTTNTAITTVWRWWRPRQRKRRQRTSALPPPTTLPPNGATTTGVRASEPASQRVSYERTLRVRIGHSTECAHKRINNNTRNEYAPPRTT